jgi:hypothetical protein
MPLEIYQTKPHCYAVIPKIELLWRVKIKVSSKMKNLSIISFVHPSKLYTNRTVDSVIQCLQVAQLFHDLLQHVPMRYTVVRYRH